MRRNSLSRGKSNKIWKRNAGKSHKRNRVVSRRGGTRL